jgi:hypothetical protein
LVDILADILDNCTDRFNVCFVCLLLTLREGPVVAEGKDVLIMILRFKRKYMLTLQEFMNPFVPRDLEGLD